MGQGIIVMGRRIRLRFFLFAAFIIVLIFLFLNLIPKQPLYDNIKYGELITWQEYTGLIVRKEEVYTAPDYGRADYFFSKGDMVEEDILLAMIYKSNYSQNLVEDLYKTKQRISDYQHKNIVTDMIDNDFDVVCNNIDDTIRTIQYKNHEYGIEDIQRQEKELRGLLDRRKTLLDKKEPTDGYLQKLYEQEKSIEEKLDQWKIGITARNSGLLAYELDGLEDILTFDIIDHITADESSRLEEFANEPTEDKESKFGVPLFKIVDPNKWYVLSQVFGEEIFLEQGDRVEIKLSGPSEITLDSMIYRIDNNKNSTLVILEMTEGVEEVMETRNVNGEIGITTQGLMVPNSSIIEKKDKFSIKLKRSGRIEQIPIKIRAKDDKWTIIEKEKITDNLEVNDSILIN